MNVNVALKRTSSPLKRPDVARIREHRWWLVFVLAISTIILGALVRSRADCQFFYQAELAVYRTQSDAYGRPPQMASMPLLTVLIRIGGQLLQTVAAWAAWTAGLYLFGLLLGQREARFGTTLKVVAWSWLPFVVRGLAQSLYMWLAQDPIFNPGLSGLIWDNTPPPPGGGYRYVPPTQSQVFWAALLEQVDVYLFWRLGLIVGGLRRVANYTPKKAWVTTLIVTLLLGGLSLAATVFGTALRQLRLF